MAQRFYPYHGRIDGYPQCDHVSCSNRASWWDNLTDAVYCDFHVAAEQANAIRVQCLGCFEWYNPAQVIDGICGTCRSAMPLMWSDEQVQQ